LHQCGLILASGQRGNGNADSAAKAENPKRLPPVARKCPFARHGTGTNARQRAASERGVGKLWAGRLLESVNQGVYYRANQSENEQRKQNREHPVKEASRE